MNQKKTNSREAEENIIFKYQINVVVINILSDFLKFVVVILYSVSFPIFFYFELNILFLE